MALTGTHYRSLDEKQRLAIPKRLRDAIVNDAQPVLFVAPETDGAVALYSVQEFERRASLLAETTSKPAAVRNYQRLYYSQAEQVDVDGQGRIRLPDRLVAFAHLNQEVVLLGVQDHIEIWDKQAWEAFLQRNGAEFDQIANAAFGQS